MNLEDFCFLYSLHYNTARQSAYLSASTYTKMMVLFGSAFSNLRKSELLIFGVSSTTESVSECVYLYNDAGSLRFRFFQSSIK